MTKLQPSQYDAPSRFVMRDGRAALIRGAVPEDVGAFERFVEALSEETVYFRFLTVGIDRKVLVKELSPRPGSYILVALKDGAIIGHASYSPYEPEAAEIGLLVLDGYQGLGLGTALVERIATEANASGISVFEAVIGWNNTRMIKLVRSLGFPTSERVEPDLIRIRFPTSIDPVSIAKFQERWVFKPG